jgi:DUF438 domain-containing protein
MKTYKNINVDENPIEMKKHLDIDNDRVDKMIDIKLKVFNKELTPAEARELVNKTFDHITAEEFAYGEQHLYNSGITDEIMAEGMDDIIDVFRDVLSVNRLDLPAGHPIQTYSDEAAAIKKVVHKMEVKLKGKFIKNEWLELYAQLSQINTHFSRKQHQLFSALERKGFDRPSKIMWTFDDRVRDAIKDAYELLQSDKDQSFVEAQPNVIHLVRDILSKERDVLYPTSLKLLSDEEFAEMRISDDEIGYCLIEKPLPYKGAATKTEQMQGKDSPAADSTLLQDLKAVLEKHGVAGNGSSKGDLLDVTTGRITLEQINLIYKHMQVDLSFVDENDEVRFYTDTKHRIFPRSAGVIGRKVQNCHPRESLHMVEAVINAFRSGEQDTAEFWIDKGEKFIYILFTALRDDAGNYRGTLESMQEVAHIRSLTGSQRLLNWDKDYSKKESKEPPEAPADEKQEITPKTIVGPLIKRYPFIKDFLVSLSPEYDKLNNPIIFNTMKHVASLSMISQVGGFEVDNLIQLIKDEIKRKT